MKKVSQITNSKTEITPIDILLGRAAMVGFICAFASYLTVDIVSPGLI